MKTLKTLRIDSKLHDQLSKMSKKSKISITALSEIAITSVLTCSAEDLLDVIKAKDNAYNKAIDRLISSKSFKAHDPDEIDKLIESTVKTESVAKPDKPATRIDTDHIEPTDTDGDINDILGGMDL